MTSWLVRNKRVLLLITGGVASLPFIPGWVRAAFDIGSQILGGITT